MSASQAGPMRLAPPSTREITLNATTTTNPARLRLDALVRARVQTRTDADQQPSPAGEHPRLLLTIPEAAEALGLGRSTLYELIAAGRLEVVHIGRSARVPVDALGSFLAALRQ
jgi:excisionase family DNA binding protein